VETNEPVVIHTTNNLAEAEVLKNVLAGAGIKCDVNGENQSGFAGVIEVQLVVRAWDEARARHLLASHSHGYKGQHDKHG
jgi:hypothetical protein